MLCGTNDTVLKEDLGDDAHDESGPDFAVDVEKHARRSSTVVPPFFRRGTSHLHFHSVGIV